MRNYYLSMLAILALVCCGLAIDFLLSAPKAPLQFLDLKTEYEVTEVDGFIQPLPTVKAIDIHWAQLGKALFHSNLLSADNSISCASCHMVQHGGDDGFPVSTGVYSQTGERNSPTVLNAALNFRQFWDGRASDLFEQAAGPVHNPVEMATNWPEVIGKLSADEYFVQAFAEIGQTEISANAILKAIVIYEESLLTPHAPFDQYLLGDQDALTEQQIRGFNTFQQIGCVTCHQGRNIGGNMYQKLGRIDQIPSFLLDDLGLYKVTNKESDKYVFKVPSLRNVALTAPYFHNGSVSELSQAVDIMAMSQLGIQLSATDNADIVAFLTALSAPVYDFNHYAVN